MKRMLRAVVAAGIALVVLAPGSALAATPDTTPEPVREQEYWLDDYGIREAWATTRGEGVRIAIIDTGIGKAPAFDGAVVGGTDVSGEGSPNGRTPVGVVDANHGSWVASLAAARDIPGGMIGVAPEAELLSVSVGFGSSTTVPIATQVAEAIRWSVDHGADVINLSLGDDSASAHPEPAEDEAVQYALSKGSVVVASAGNGGEKGDNISYPAAYPGVIAVTAVDRYGTRASFSTRRWYATVSAPGVDVVIADPDRRYYEGWGTSAAAAFVSGAVALIRAVHPDLTPAQIKKLLQDTARNAPVGGRDDSRGFGLVDPAAAIKAADRLERQDLRAASHTGKYFGPGPEPAAPDGGASDWAGPLVGSVGGVLLVVAAVLWRGRRRDEDGGFGSHGPGGFRFQSSGGFPSREDF